MEGSCHSSRYCCWGCWLVQSPAYGQVLHRNPNRIHDQSKQPHDFRLNNDDNHDSSRSNNFEPHFGTSQKGGTSEHPKKKLVRHPHHPASQTDLRIGHHIIANTRLTLLVKVLTQNTGVKPLMAWHFVNPICRLHRRANG